MSRENLQSPLKKVKERVQNGNHSNSQVTSAEKRIWSK